MKKSMNSIKVGGIPAPVSHVEQLVLDKLTVGLNTSISPYILGEARLDILPQISNDLVIRLQQEIAAKSVEITPASWWQHFICRLWI